MKHHDRTSFEPDALARIAERRRLQTLRRAFETKRGVFRAGPVKRPALPRSAGEILKDRVDSFQKRTNCERPFTVDDVLRKFGMHPVCYLTGQRLSWWRPASYQLDHFVPVCKGGDSGFDNLRIAAPHANKMKDGHLFDDFIAICSTISQLHSKK